MKATKTHISLETAKLLKDCGVKSEYAYYNNPYHGGVSARQLLLKYKEEGYSQKEFYCFAYTWQEILWENAEKFFGNKKLVIRNNKTKHITLEVRKSNSEWENASYVFVHFSMHILSLLQQKKYDEADLYFREHCILINPLNNK